MMLNKKQWIIFLLLLTVGFLLALKTLHIDYMVLYSNTPNYKSFCNINDVFNCDAVAASSYSSIFGVPIALLGTIGTLFLILFNIYGRCWRQTSLLAINFTLFAFFSLGCLLLAFISFFLISGFCIVCMLFWLTCFVSLFFLARVYRPRSIKQLVQDLVSELLAHKMAVIVGLILFIMVNSFLVKSVFTQTCHRSSELSQECLNFEPHKNRTYLGLHSAPLEVYVYTDFQCPFCKKAAQFVEKLAAKYKEQVKFVRKEFPLDQACNPSLKDSFHDFACLAAYFAKCAGKQGKYWTYHDQIYEHNDELSPELLRRLAEQEGLNMAELESCVYSVEIKDIVNEDIQEGIRLRVEGTPTFRIFGEILVGSLQEKDIKEYLQHYPYLPLAKLKLMYEQSTIGEIQLVDLAEEEDFVHEHLLSAIMNRNDLTLDPARPVLLMGEDQQKLQQEFAKLQDKGFKNMLMLKGGLNEWKKTYGDLNIIKVK